MAIDDAWDTMTPWCLRPTRRKLNRGNNSLLLLPESEQTHTRHLDNLETHTGDITLGLSATTETRDEDLVVLVGKVQTTVIGDESLFISCRLFLPVSIRASLPM